MQIIADIPALRTAIKTARAAGQRIGFVPTMGALHQGHLELVKIARQQADIVVASIFVNPTQFGPNEDYSRYPRDIPGDSEKLKSVGADIVFTPQAEDIYPPDNATAVSVSGVTTEFEGRIRPTHFAGVTLIVAKLFNIVQPDSAVFGEKDFQQLATIRRMVADLNFPINIIGAPIVREADGLALSSRNIYLSPAQRRIAPQLQQVLQAAARAINNGAPVAAALAQGQETLSAAGFDAVDYLALVDAVTLAPMAQRGPDPARLLAATRLGATRLIDNIALDA